MGLRFQPRSLLTVFLIAFFIFIVVQSSDMPEKAKMYPWVVGLIALALLAFQLVREILPARGDEPRETRETGADVDFTDEEASPEGRRRTLELFGWIYGFTLLLWLIGFYLSIPVMVFAYLLRHREGPILTVVMPTVAGLATWGLFDNLLNLPFPPGVLFEWLGLV
jgi:hypothetical protein